MSNKTLILSYFAAVILYIPTHELGHVLCVLASGYRVTSWSLTPYWVGSNLVMGYVKASGYNPLIWAGGFLITFIPAAILFMINKKYRVFSLVWLGFAPATSSADFYHIFGEIGFQTANMLSAGLLMIWFIRAGQELGWLK
jgi:hypothetical protein